MIYSLRRYLAVAALMISLLNFCACSKTKEAQEGANVPKPGTQKAADEIRDFGKKPIDKARAVKGLGDERTQAVDEAVKGQAE